MLRGWSWTLTMLFFSLGVVDIVGLHRDTILLNSIYMCMDIIPRV